MGRRRVPLDDTRINPRQDDEIDRLLGVQPSTRDTPLRSSIVPVVAPAVAPAAAAPAAAAPAPKQRKPRSCTFTTIDHDFANCAGRGRVLRCPFKQEYERQKAMLIQEQARDAARLDVERVAAMRLAAAEAAAEAVAAAEAEAAAVPVAVPAAVPHVVAMPTPVKLRRSGSRVLDKMNLSEYRHRRAIEAELSKLGIQRLPTTKCIYPVAADNKDGYDECGERTTDLRTKWCSRCTKLHTANIKRGDLAAIDYNQYHHNKYIAPVVEMERLKRQKAAKEKRKLELDEACDSVSGAIIAFKRQRLTLECEIAKDQAKQRRREKRLAESRQPMRSREHYEVLEAVEVSDESDESEFEKEGYDDEAADSSSDDDYHNDGNIDAELDAEARNGR